MNGVPAIIWDMDGVLVDTVSLNWTGRRLALALHDIVISDQEIAGLEGQPLEAHFAYFAEAKGLAVGFDEFKTQYKKLSRVLYELQPPQTPAALTALLQEFKQNKLAMGVGTTSTRGRAERLLQAADLSSYFDVLVAKEDVAEHKPNPAVFLEVADRLGVRPTDCVVIEDAANGLQAARAAGMKSIGVVGAFFGAHELTAADMVIGNFSELDYARSLGFVSTKNEAGLYPSQPPLRHGPHQPVSA